MLRDFARYFETSRDASRLSCIARWRHNKSAISLTGRCNNETSGVFSREVSKKNVLVRYFEDCIDVKHATLLSRDFNSKFDTLQDISDVSNI
mmetsp:Transcript_19865/g.49308  ORF Transcript_19865/g.49308 Transcript_19865/m.49308 type:complete len:92 (-) Transcript_19865:3365-3640(-)